ncbi:zinc-dependent metalloprotease [Flavobacterium hercynium]|uniref:Propanediol utilization protein n=1 Tax=Flavobacterium hercynium TaxID=387094 RepID=A0A226HL20_9FLAO|nr:zinc-dependent metalloprotease family protein [Flavobacterium hercynium]OXA94885.1 propanediol utilization protein [Flavobacterium hercynium]SMP09013.1 Por secretion system C-terminal sorting domain-containing protein [Flavobacterium hercynium]
MKKILLFLLIIFSCFEINAQSNDLWQKSTLSSALNKKINDESSSGKLYYKLNVDLLKKKLSAATSKTSGSKSYEITIPNLDGKFEKFAVSEYSNFEPELQAKYPEIRSYQGHGIDDKSAKIHFSVSPLGLQTMVFRADKATELIEKNTEDETEYALFTFENSENPYEFICTTDTSAFSESTTGKTAKISSNKKVFKKMRLALSCTGDYAQYFGGTKAGALAGMNATMTRINGIFNKDLALQLILVANTDAVIYTDPATDPYGSQSGWNRQVQLTLTNEIGDANYDIGHLFSFTGGGGNAGCIGCVCSSPASQNSIEKGGAYSSVSNIRKPDLGYFDLVVAHEMGHQLGANHTFSYALEGNLWRNVNVEPGSGSTIMGYAGVSGGYDVQNTPDDYFAYSSILQIMQNLDFKRCPVNIQIANNPPIINAGADYEIPISTAFVLKGTGSDPEGDQVTYNWEENDAATTTSKANSIAYPTKPDGPLFRSVKPGTSPIRYMPDLNLVLQNRLSTSWESVSSISRKLNFTLTGRDNAGLGMAQTNTDAMFVDVTSLAGPFVVTSQSTDNVYWDRSSSQKITWDVNNTDKLTGSSTVNIKMSIDGGLTFPFILASNTPNDGSEVVVAPTNVKASINCRILVEPTGNIYYAVNSKPFSIGYGAAASCNSYSFGSGFDIPESARFTERTVRVPALNDKLLNISVALNVEHQRSSDLEIEIVSPRGTTVQLFNRNCNSNKLDLLFDDAGFDLDCSNTSRQIVLPVNYLKTFLGEDPQGVWTFRIRDRYVNVTGRINAASLEICTGDPSLGTTNPELKEDAFAVFPNPNKGSFTVQFQSKSLLGVKVYVHDVFGKNVYADTFESSADFSQKINLPGIAAGVYLVTVVDGSQKMVKKIIVN